MWERDFMLDKFSRCMKFWDSQRFIVKVYIVREYVAGETNKVRGKWLSWNHKGKEGFQMSAHGGSFVLLPHPLACISVSSVCFARTTRLVSENLWERKQLSTLDNIQDLWLALLMGISNHIFPANGSDFKFQLTYRAILFVLLKIRIMTYVIWIFYTSASFCKIQLFIWIRYLKVKLSYKYLLSKWNNDETVLVVLVFMYKIKYSTNIDNSSYFW